jgi:hypothetical protein
VAVVQDLTDEQRSKVPRPEDRDKARRVHLAPVQIGRDYGTEVEITGGVERGQLVVINPGDIVVDNALVLPRMLQEAPAAEAGASKPAAPSERAPSGIQSPSMQAPTQSANSRAGGARTR